MRAAVHEPVARVPGAVSALSVDAFTAGELDVRVCRDGKACFQLRSATGSNIHLQRVTVSELEPRPKTTLGGIR